MAGEALLITRFAAVGLLLLLAAWLLWLRFTNPVNRAFAFVLAVFAFRSLAFRLQEITGDVYWERVAGYFALAMVPALAYFLLVYAGPARLANSPARWSLLVLGGAIEVSYALDHCLFRCVGDSGLRVIGPLGLLGYSDAFAFAAVGVVLAVQSRRAPPGARRSGTFLASAAFVLNAVLVGSIILGVVASAGIAGTLRAFEPSPWPALALAETLLAFVPCAVAFALYAAPPRATSGRRVAAAAVLALAAMATGLWVGSRLVAYETLGNAALGLWQLLFLGLIVVAIVRHQLFDLDVKLRWTIKQSTVAAVFIGVFFVVSEVAQSYLSQQIGPYLGIAAAGLILFALVPLQHAAERVAHRAVPGGRDLRRVPPAERAEAFRTAVELALADGVVNRAEERALARFATQLGLDPARALALREEVEAALAAREGGGAGARRGGSRAAD